MSRADRAVPSGHDPAALIGAPVAAYWNLHHGCVSLAPRGGGPVAHTTSATLVAVRLAVQPGGRERVRREHAKNVHAYVRGTLAALGEAPPPGAVEVTYDPYTMDTFATTAGVPVTSAARVVVAAKRVWIIEA